jgi:hypothetical protein
MAMLTGTAVEHGDGRTKHPQTEAATQMFKHEVQSSHISIFSSTGSHPLGFWHTEVDPGLPKDSHVTLVDDVENMSASKDLDYIQLEENKAQSITLSHPVLHIQSPALSGTFIRCPVSMSESLGIVLPWLHFQVRNLGKPWAFEIGVSDSLGHQASMRFSTFQVCLLLISCLSLTLGDRQEPK